MAKVLKAVSRIQVFVLFLLLFGLARPGFAQSNVNVRIMAANLNGNVQSYQPFAIRIFQGLKPDVICIQEFNYSNNTTANIRAMVDTAFGTNYSYYRESSSFQIPNGIISRYPILASGSWSDSQQSQPNRGFAWARIDLPGSNDLYAVSVHLLTKDATTRAAEANQLKSYIQSNFPAGAWIVIAGDFNTSTRTETAITTLASLCADTPIPTDAVSGGDSDTNNGRTKPYDYVLVSLSFTNRLTNTVFASHSFPKGLVFDSRVYTPLSDVSPVISTDSGQGQHMGVLKDFSIPVTGSNPPVAPIISSQPQNKTVAVGDTAVFNVTATGTDPLKYQWRFNTTNIVSATNSSYSISNAQTTNSGSFSVIITNTVGAVTSSAAILLVSNVPPFIVTQPATLSVYAGETAAFSVEADGTAPLAYQWRFNGGNISGAVDADYSFNNAQTNQAGNYTVVVTNASGSVTSVVAVLTVSNANPVILTQPASASINEGSPASFSVVAGGASPLEYQWRLNGLDIVDANSSDYDLVSAQVADAGNYTVVVSNLTGSVTSSVATLTVTPAITPSYTGILAGWDVGGLTNYGPSPLSTATNAPHVTVVGLTRGPGVTTSGSAASRAWGGDGFASTSTNTAVTAGDYVTCGVTADTGYRVSFSAISRFDYRRSPTGPTDGLLQYQINGGAFNDAAIVAYPVSTSAGASFGTIDLSGIAALQNMGAGTNVTFRIVNYNGAAAGNWYLYDVASSSAVDFAIDGSLTPVASTPAVVAVLSNLVVADGVLQVDVVGTATSNYIVQATTNLPAASWTPLVTNASPFTFMDSNANSFPRRFYRVKAAP